MRSPFFRKTFPIRKLPDRQGVKKAHHLGVKDFVLKAGRSTEAATFRRLIKKFPRQGTRIYKVSQQKGLRKVQSLSNRLGITSGTLQDTSGTKGLARGGPVRANKAYVVGEEGPEIMIAKSSGKVLSNDDSQIFAMLLAANPQLQKVSKARAEKIMRSRFPEYFE